MKKIGITLSVVFTVLVLAIACHAGWVNDGDNSPAPNGQKYFDWSWWSPVWQDTHAGSCVLLVMIVWTDLGRQYNKIPSNVMKTEYDLEIDLANNRFIYLTQLNYDFNGNEIQNIGYPYGYSNWMVPTPGTIAEDWMRKARNAPKTTDMKKLFMNKRP